MASKPELSIFVREALTAGKSRTEIAEVLRTAGWAETEVKDALNAWAETDFSPPVPRPQATVSARDFFVYALTFGVLIFGAVNLVVLLNALIDILAGDDKAYWLRRTIRWTMAALIVTAPLYLWLTRRDRIKLALDPAQYRSAIRKWLIYITLLLAASTLMGDLITVIYRFLQGDVTLQFLGKAAVVATISGAIFLYYLTDIRRGDAA